MADQRIVTTYKCQNPKCEAKDTDRGFNPPAPLALNCFKCKAQGAMLKESEQIIEAA